jgi:hypothetical protein
MTVQEVEEGLESIRATMREYDDDEAAHSAEDRLREQVLEAVAYGAPNAKELAEAVLKSSEIDFSRWCA